MAETPVALSERVHSEVEHEAIVREKLLIPEWLRTEA